MTRHRHLLSGKSEYIDKLGSFPTYQLMNAAAYVGKYLGGEVRARRQRARTDALITSEREYRAATNAAAASRGRAKSRGVPYVGRPRTVSANRHKSKARKRKTSKKRKTKTKRVLNFAGKGSIYVDETLGTITDPDMCYLYVHDHAPGRLYATVAQALVRKICEKAFMTSYMSSFQAVLSGTDINLGAIFYKMRVRTMLMGSGNMTTSTITIDQASTIDSLANSLNTFIENVGQGDGTTHTANTFELTNISIAKEIYSLGGTVIVDEVLLASLNMQEEIVHVKVTTEVKLQNRSVASDGSADTADVNMTPAECFNMRFSGIPHHKYLANGPTAGVAQVNVGGQLFSKLIKDSGHLSVRGAALTAQTGNGNNWQKVQMKGNFNNCKSQSKSIIPPGGITKVKLVFEKSYPFNNYLKKVLNNFDLTGGERYVSNTLGGGNMLCLQDMININTTYNLTFTWQIDRETKCVLVSKHQPSFERQFTSATYDNTA